MTPVDVLILGAGASGLMCAIEAGRRGQRTVVLDHAQKAGTKIVLSGGGRCNFTNRTIETEGFICGTPHFVKSALSRYTAADFIAFIERHKIRYHERDFGRLFCDERAEQIVDALVLEAEQQSVQLRLGTTIRAVQQRGEGGFCVTTDAGRYHARSLVVATGGPSYPQVGASSFGYDLAKQFGLKVVPPEAGLVPLILSAADKDRLARLAGIALKVRVACGAACFEENLLFTHRGLSGPAMLQVSNYWQPGETLTVDLIPDFVLEDTLKRGRKETPVKRVRSFLATYLPKRLIAAFVPSSLADSQLAQLSDVQCRQLDALFKQWSFVPAGKEGFRSAEVTCGGVDCHAISSKTMACHKVPGLYFIGEVLDVTGWLGGYNLQWAWSSGWTAGQVV